jgi:signal transduction histidine kinase
VTPPQARPLQRRIALSFAVLIAGFVGAAVYVPLALWPGAERAEALQLHRADAAQVLGEVADAARGLRSAAEQAYAARWDRTIVRSEQERDFAASRDRLRALVQRHRSLPAPSPELDRLWTSLAHRRIPALVAAADSVVEASLVPEIEPTVLHRLQSTSAAVGDTLHQITTLSVEAARTDAELIHARVRRLALGYAALAAVGTAGALLLLSQTLSLLRRYVRATEQRVSELDAFAGQVSHDLRSPLQTIMLAAESIQQTAQDGSIRGLAAVATGGVDRLDGMIRDLLEFARSGAAAPETARADVDAVLQEVRDKYRSAAERAGVALTVAGAPEVHARVAPVALEAIAANLVQNAIKYRRPAEGARVDVLATADAERVVLAVKDNGVGIAPALLPRIFEPFVRGARRPDSYGLGLATVRRLVDAHQGEIAVASQEGSGSTFTVSFQRAEPPAQVPEPARLRAASAPT